MLVLTRNINEKITIGKDAEVVVQILSIRGKQVRLGISASKNVPVHRSEIYDLIHAEKTLSQEQESVE